MDLEKIGYFLFMAEQEKKQSEEFTENDYIISTENDPQQTQNRE